MADLDLTGVVFSADALHTQRETARHLVADRGAHYCVLTVKGNQPSLLTACQKMLSDPARAFAPEHVTFDRGHGRTEQRTTRVAPVGGESAITFPYAARSSGCAATSADWTASEQPRRSPTASPA